MIPSSVISVKSVEVAIFYSKGSRGAAIAISATASVIRVVKGASAHLIWIMDIVVSPETQMEAEVLDRSVKCNSKDKRQQVK